MAAPALFGKRFVMRNRSVVGAVQSHFRGFHSKRNVLTYDAYESLPPIPFADDDLEYVEIVAALIARQMTTSAAFSGEAAFRRDVSSRERDEAAVRRDDVARARDAAGASSDRTANERDVVARRRDRIADQRDLAASERDTAGSLRDVSGADGFQSERFRAALDRAAASDDRRAAAYQRLQAEADRATSLAGRGAGARERAESGADRGRSLEDRGASAFERENASADGLTGAYLRGPGFVELKRDIGAAQRTGEPLVVAFVDVNGLKAVNDVKGHAAGDRLLAALADILRKNLRFYDRIIRYGGDEFICVLPRVTLLHAGSRLQMVNRELADLAEPGSISVGYAVLEPNDSLESFIGRADADLYRMRKERTA